MKWRLRLFRFGLFACVALAIVAATQFHIVNYVVAIWNGNPTADTIAAVTLAATDRKAACSSAETRSATTEYPSHCYPIYPSFPGLPGDKAWENVEGFLMTGLALFVLLLAVVSLGLRMAIANRADSHINYANRSSRNG